MLRYSLSHGKQNIKMISHTKYNVREAVAIKVFFKTTSEKCRIVFRETVVSKHVLCFVLIKLQAYILQLHFSKDAQAQTAFSNCRHRSRPCSRSSHRRCSVRKAVLRNFSKFTGEHLCRSLFLK